MVRHYPIELRERIAQLPEYFTIHEEVDSLLKKKPHFAKRAISLLDKIEDLTGKEFVFLEIQSPPFGGTCAPRPIDYDPSNRVNLILRKYDRQYFLDFLQKNS